MSLRAAHPNLFDKDDSDAEPVDERLLGQVSYFLNLFGALIGKDISAFNVERDPNGGININYGLRSLYFWDNGFIDIIEYQSDGLIINKNLIGNWKKKNAKDRII